MSKPVGLKPLPEVRIERGDSESGSPLRKAKKSSGVGTEGQQRKTKKSGDAGIGSPIAKSKKSKSQALMGNSAASGSDSVPDLGSHGSPMKNRSSKEMAKLSHSSNTREETTISVTESLPEVKVKAPSKQKGRMVPSRYKESAKNRAVATPTKIPDSSCISINQSKLFSTATSSTPVMAGGKVQDVSIRPKQPPKMASLDATIRQRPTASAADVALGKDKGGFKVKKSEKTASIKVKPMRAEAPAKKPAGGDQDHVSEHQLLYNQYLQWTYLCRKAEASARSEQPHLSQQARQLSGLVDTARQNCTDLERKLQAVTLHQEIVQLERQVGAILSAINDSADTVRADLSHLATTLDATRSRLQLRGCVEPRDAELFVDELVAAAERCREALSALDGAVSPHANLLEHTAEAVSSLQQALRDSGRHMTTSSEMLQELSSLALQEASLSLSAVPPVPQTAALTSSG